MLPHRAARRHDHRPAGRPVAGIRPRVVQSARGIQPADGVRR